ncbi:troponin C isoform X1 [Uranotaenia lowii]|uniref:troponin C isoform X1 n=1 Tax=Uranotaenia lowii TaxID=190385 RepID=UPI002478448D|nr:troponin C isoform X1 [Uranotaenia lowii]
MEIVQKIVRIPSTNVLLFLLLVFVVLIGGFGSFLGGIGVHGRRPEDLPKEQVELLKNAFNAFDQEKNGYIGTEMVGTILSMLGHSLDDKLLKEIIDEVDADGSGELEFEEFCTLAARFLVEEDAEAMQQELKEAFRLYDKEGNGYITTDVLREILKELDSNLTNDDLDMMIEEIDSDGSGTVDFDEFMEIMTGGDD